MLLGRLATNKQLYFCLFLLLLFVCLFVLGRGGCWGFLFVCLFVVFLLYYLRMLNIEATDKVFMKDRHAVAI